jgi:hypothetical protein
MVQRIPAVAGSTVGGSIAPAIPLTLVMPAIRMIIRREAECAQLNQSGTVAVDASASCKSEGPKTLPGLMGNSKGRRPHPD